MQAIRYVDSICPVLARERKRESHNKIFRTMAVFVLAGLAISAWNRSGVVMKPSAQFHSGQRPVAYRGPATNLVIWSLTRHAVVTARHPATLGSAIDEWATFVPQPSAEVVTPPLLPVPLPARPSPPKALPHPVVSPSAPVQQTPSASQWAELRQCESGGNWQTDTGNGFYGAYQFTLSSWAGVGMGGMPNAAPPATQTAAAIRLWTIQGWRAWPVCSVKLGFRK